MHPDDKELLLAEIFQDLHVSKEYVMKILEEIRINDVSKYPIIVISKSEIAVGLKILDKQDFNLKWNYNISHLEEFVLKNLVKKEKAQEFIRMYKEHDKHLCLFITFSKKEADFAFVKKNQV